MDVMKQLRFNSLIYKRSLDRIIDKYSKLQNQDGAIEVDLTNINTRSIERYMRQSKSELNKLESKTLTDLSNESLRAQDITRDSELDFTHQAGKADETCVSTVSSTQLSVEDDGILSCDTTTLTTSLLDESQRSLSEAELQPEDQDEELEMSLRSHGSSLVELYPSMISRLGRAWRRQQVSEAADSVLRRYRRWRQQPNRSYVNNTFIVPLRQKSTKKMNNKTLLKENSNSSVRIQFKGTDTTPQSPRQRVTNLQDWQAQQQQQSPGRVRGSLTREQHQPVFVMDLSGSPDTSKPKEVSLNKTFNVSQLGKQFSTNAVSPSRPFYPTAKASLDQSLRAKRLSLTAHSSYTTAVKERPDIYGSPVRQSPLKARMTSLSRSPHAFSGSPKAHSVESFSREPLRSRFVSTFHSPPQKPAVPLRVFYPQDSRHSFQLPQLSSPQSATAAAGRPRLRRHLSFDSSLPSNRVSCSPKKLDEEFIKLYHKFVCQNKLSSFNGPPCRFCCRKSEASKGHSSSALAALALSPHRSLLRKRHRELTWNNHPQSKRSRDEYCISSPPSKCHGNEMLRRRLSLSEYEQCHDDLCYSPSKHSMFQRFGTQQCSADAHLDTSVSRGRDMSAGGSLESKMANSFSPRKWW
ncbi:uncharacterized protein si:dkeyp-117h8.4 isoform X2 [Chelmon rostratus]|uniref:uncharacterized protein si:dkeyp-117h8.4 isoform X2 n=1 Tax=Chelmon rostratus TaxID=109905 RepID=UPI001BE8EB57|nr:uncharacterized protein si:dkeyp-117h8.4 isoform X2 [Chelmon rostratus]